LEKHEIRLLSKDTVRPLCERTSTQRLRNVSLIISFLNNLNDGPIFDKEIPGKRSRGLPVGGDSTIDLGERSVNYTYQSSGGQILNVNFL